MTEKLFNNNEPIADIVASIYEECRANVDLYNSPTGFGTDLNGVDWNVCYWPAFEDSDGSHLDRVTVSRDFKTRQNPAAYHVSHDGTIRKNETIEKRVPGGLIWDPNGEVLVDDIDEANLILAIVRTAHITRRNSRH